MEKAGNSDVRKRDSDDVFGEYIATEMRTIQDLQTKQWVKYQIQSLFFSAHSGSMLQPPQAFDPRSRNLAPLATGTRWDYSNPSPVPNQWSTPPFRTPSTTPSTDNFDYTEYADN